MDIQERYDELDTLIRGLDLLIDNLTDKDYIDQLRETMYQAQNELEEIKPILQEQYDREEQELENQYIRSVL